MADTETKRDRSPNYPYISLQQALERARQFYAAEKRGAAAIPVVAKHWDYSPKSSGLIQSIAALKSYGLLDEEGRGQDRRVKLSELVLRIILDQRPQSPERAEQLYRAATMPAIAQKILEKFPDNVPSEHNLEHFLIFDLKFTPESAKAAAKLYMENAVFTGLYISGIISAQSTEHGETMQEKWGETLAPLAALAPKAAQTNVNTDRITGPTGQILLTFVGEPNLDAYKFLEDYIKLRMSVLTRAQSQQTKEKGEEANPPTLRRTA